jgi:hypothetical protein
MALNKEEIDKVNALYKEIDALKDQITTLKSVVTSREDHEAVMTELREVKALVADVKRCGKQSCETE